MAPAASSTFRCRIGIVNQQNELPPCLSRNSQLKRASETRKYFAGIGGLGAHRVRTACNKGWILDLGVNESTQYPTSSRTSSPTSRLRRTALRLNSLELFAVRFAELSSPSRRSLRRHPRRKRALKTAAVHHRLESAGVFTGWHRFSRDTSQLHLLNLVVAGVVIFCFFVLFYRLHYVLPAVLLARLAFSCRRTVTSPVHRAPQTERSHNRPVNRSQ